MTQNPKKKKIVLLSRQPKPEPKAIPEEEAEEEEIEAEEIEGEEESEEGAQRPSKGSKKDEKKSATKKLLEEKLPQGREQTEGLTINGRVPGTPLLNYNHERFCQIWTTDVEFFGNGVKSYGLVYGLDLSDQKEYHVAKACAARLLTNAILLERIGELIEVFITDQLVDKELGTVIKQNADFSSKVAAIREYNRVKGRITNKVKVSGSLETDMDDEQFDRLLEHVSKRRQKKKV